MISFINNTLNILKGKNGKMTKEKNTSDTNVSEEDENIIKNLLIFYENNRNDLSSYQSQKEKKQKIKMIFDYLNYTNNPDCISNTDIDEEEYVKIYRGISAQNLDDLRSYAEQFVNGEVFFGGRASIYGTGIYTVIGDNADVAMKYSSDGSTNNIGIIIESYISKNSKIINYKELENKKNNIISYIKNINSPSSSILSEYLEDSGLFAALWGYDAIYVEDKNYVIVLNRSKLIVNDLDIEKQLNSKSR